MKQQDVIFWLLLFLTYGFFASLIAQSPLTDVARPPFYLLGTFVMLAVIGWHYGIL